MCSTLKPGLYTLKPAQTLSIWNSKSAGATRLHWSRRTLFSVQCPPSPSLYTRMPELSESTAFTDTGISTIDVSGILNHHQKKKNKKKKRSGLAATSKESESMESVSVKTLTTAMVGLESVLILSDGNSRSCKRCWTCSLLGPFPSTIHHNTPEMRATLCLLL